MTFAGYPALFNHHSSLTIEFTTACGEKPGRMAIGANLLIQQASRSSWERQCLIGGHLSVVRPRSQGAESAKTTHLPTISLRVLYSRRVISRHGRGGQKSRVASSGLLRPRCGFRADGPARTSAAHQAAACPRASSNALQPQSALPGGRQPECKDYDSTCHRCARSRAAAVETLASYISRLYSEFGKTLSRPGGRRISTSGRSVSSLTSA